MGVDTVRLSNFNHEGVRLHQLRTVGLKHNRLIENREHLFSIIETFLSGENGGDLIETTLQYDNGIPEIFGIGLPPGEGYALKFTSPEVPFNVLDADIYMDWFHSGSTTCDVVVFDGFGNRVVDPVNFNIDHAGWYNIDFEDVSLTYNDFWVGIVFNEGYYRPFLKFCDVDLDPSFATYINYEGPTNPSLITQSAMIRTTISYEGFEE